MAFLGRDEDAAAGGGDHGLLLARLDHLGAQRDRAVGRRGLQQLDVELGRHRAGPQPKPSAARTRALPRQASLGAAGPSTAVRSTGKLEAKRAPESFLVRVVLELGPTREPVVTVYRTSKIEKYRSKP